MIDLKDMPEQVQSSVSALIENAKKVEDWNIPDMEDGKCFADTIPYVEVLKDGRIEVCDSYERFFNVMYIYNPKDDTWEVRWMYADRAPAPYTFDECMADAQIMFTG